jgi:DNA repair protein RadC
MVARVRELEIRYKAGWGTLPTSGRVSTAHDAAKLASTLLADSPVEKMLALHLNTKHELIGVHIVSVGCLDATIVHPREVLQGVLLSNAAAFIVAHNILQDTRRQALMTVRLSNA